MSVLFKSIFLWWSWGTHFAFRGLSTLHENNSYFTLSFTCKLSDHSACHFCLFVCFTFCNIQFIKLFPRNSSIYFLDRKVEEGYISRQGTQQPSQSPSLPLLCVCVQRDKISFTTNNIPPLSVLKCSKIQKVLSWEDHWRPLSLLGFTFSQMPEIITVFACLLFY